MFQKNINKKSFK